MVSDDRKVTFRLRAPNAKDVKVDGDWTKKPALMAKDEKGIWTYTTEPLEPDLYGYFFVVDGTASVRRNGRRVTTLGPGKWFGELYQRPGRCCKRWENRNGRKCKPSIAQTISPFST